MDNVKVQGEFGEKPEISFLASNSPQGLKVEILSEGDGQVINKGDLIECDYHGTVWDGNVFDSSFERGGSATFPVGVGSLIKAWDEGIVGHKVGSRLLITATPEYAYGAQSGQMFGIGQEDALVFVVDIIAVKG